MLPIRDSVRRIGKSKMTKRIILANTLVFLLELFISQEGRTQFFHNLGLVPARDHSASIFQAWPYLTHMFLHGGWAHFIGNIWTLWIFGSSVEGRMGTRRYLLFYLLCGLGAALVQIYASPKSTIPVVGASGAISGVMGAYFVLFPKAKIVLMIPIFFLPYFIQISAFFYIGVWFLMQFFSGAISLLGPGQVGGIAWWAHVGGFVTGFFIFWMFLKRKKRRPKQELII